MSLASIISFGIYIPFLLFTKVSSSLFKEYTFQLSVQYTSTFHLQPFHQSIQGRLIVSATFPVNELMSVTTVGFPYPNFIFDFSGSVVTLRQAQ